VNAERANRISRIDKIFYLADEIEILKGRIQEHGTGTIITAIGVMEHRIKELKAELRDMEKQMVFNTLSEK
jgi:DNA-binding HxlR family transcriptional regulator